MLYSQNLLHFVGLHGAARNNSHTTLEPVCFQIGRTSQITVNKLFFFFSLKIKSVRVSRFFEIY